MACDRGSGRVPGKRIQQRHSGEELEMAGWFWRQGTARQSDSGTRGSETNNKVAEEKRRRCRCAFTLGCGHCYSCQGWVGSGPRVVSSAQRRLRLPVVQCRGSATAPEGRDAGCPPPTPHQRPFGASRPESSPSPFPIRAPTGVREKHFGQSSIVFFHCQLPHSIRMPNGMETFQRIVGCHASARQLDAADQRFVDDMCPVNRIAASWVPLILQCRGRLECLHRRNLNLNDDWKDVEQEAPFLVAHRPVKSPLNLISNSGHPPGLRPIVQHSTAPPRGWLCCRLPRCRAASRGSTPKDWVWSLRALMHTPWRSPRRHVVALNATP